MNAEYQPSHQEQEILTTTEKTTESMEGILREIEAKGNSEKFERIKNAEFTRIAIVAGIAKRDQISLVESAELYSKEPAQVRDML